MSKRSPGNATSNPMKTVAVWEQTRIKFSHNPPGGAKIKKKTVEGKRGKSDDK